VRLPKPDEVVAAHAIIKAAKTFPRMGTMEESYARETVLLAERPPQVTIPLQVMKVGELRVAAIPAEAFVEIGLELKKRHQPTFAVSLANGYYGYLPTPEQHRLGGYETWRARSSFLEVDASTKIIAALGECYEKLK
jgi:neutral ceramidase